METKQVITILAVIMVAIAVVNLAIVITRVRDFDKAVTGFATGYVNISVLSGVEITLTTSQIDWGAGAVLTNESYDNATLYTVNNGTASVTGGNWSTSGVTAIVIRNDGQTNVTLNASSDRNATDMFGGTAARRAFQWNWTNAETGSCSGGSITENTWADVNVSTEILCSEFSPYPDRNELFLDILLRVPDDFDTSLYPGTTERRATLTIEGTAN